MTKSRLEAFSDGVLAIILTIMVLELHRPQGVTWAAFSAVRPNLAAYLLSFVFVGIYWVNHHHTFQAVTHISGPVLWANLHLLFWLSLVPFATGWMAEGGRELVPVLFYGIVLICAGTAYTIMVRALLAVEGPDSILAKAIGKDVKGWLSVAFYSLALLLGAVDTRISYALYVLVALMWLAPDPRIARHLNNDPKRKKGH